MCEYSYHLSVIDREIHGLRVHNAGGSDSGGHRKEVVETSLVEQSESLRVHHIY